MAASLSPQAALEDVIYVPARRYGQRTEVDSGCRQRHGLDVPLFQNLVVGPIGLDGLETGQNGLTQLCSVLEVSNTDQVLGEHIARHHLHRTRGFGAHITGNGRRGHNKICTARIERQVDGINLGALQEQCCMCV